MYACPLLAGVFFILVGEKYGRKYHVMLYVVSAILCFLLVPNIEQNLIFAGFFGWYPIIRPSLQKLPKILSWIVKFGIFNGVVLAIEWLVMRILVPEAVGSAILWVLLILGNITFLFYDLMIPRMEILMRKIAKLL
jgi:hypothetical protein